MLLVGGGGGLGRISSRTIWQDFLSKSYLVVHSREYHNVDENTPCDKCDIVHTDEIIPCDECGKTLNCKSSENFTF